MAPFPSDRQCRRQHRLAVNASNPHGEARFKTLKEASGETFWGYTTAGTLGAKLNRVNREDRASHREKFSRNEIRI
jgi:hypothetical protein